MKRENLKDPLFRNFRISHTAHAKFKIAAFVRGMCLGDYIEDLANRVAQELMDSANDTDIIRAAKNRIDVSRQELMKIINS